MFVKRFFNARLGVVLALVAVLATAAYAFAAANVVAESGAGDGANTISGYTIGDVTYTVNPSDPSQLTGVQFSVTPTAGAAAPTTVMAKLESTGSTWYNCVNTVSTNLWTCATPGIMVVTADELRVVATQ